jgi:hypothetical protein
MQNLADPVEHANLLRGMCDSLLEAQEVAMDALDEARGWDDVFHWAAVVSLLFRDEDRKKWN